MVIVNSVKDFGIKIDENLSFGPTHYLMLGLNPEKHGRFSAYDESLSTHSENPNERVQEEINVVFNRLKNYGFFGVLNLGIHKTITNLGNGNFLAKEVYEYNVHSQENNAFLEFFYGINNLEHNQTDTYCAFNIMAQIL